MSNKAQVTEEKTFEQVLLEALSYIDNQSGACKFNAYLMGKLLQSKDPNLRWKAKHIMKKWDVEMYGAKAIEDVDSCLGAEHVQELCALKMVQESEG